MKLQNILICSALAATLAACGSVAKTTAGSAAMTGTAATSGDAAKLTDAAAAAATTDATTTAETNDAVGGDSGDASSTEAPAPADSTASTALPAFLQVVQDARDYTRKLLGIDDSALKTFKAEVAAARALSNSPEEFKANITSAQDEFTAAMDAQKTASEAARVTNKAALDAVYKGTVQVFLACGTDVAIGEHQGRGGDQGRPEDGRRGEKGGKRPPPPRGGHGGKGPDHGGQGQDQDADNQEQGSGSQEQVASAASGSGNLASDGPRMMFGNGEFNGNFNSFMKHFNSKSSLTADASTSSECTAAVSALQVLITPAS